MKRALVIFALLRAGISWLNGTAQAQDFGHSYALVVGINQYDRPDLPKLKSAEADAQAIGQFLQSQGYDVTLQLGKNATRQHILDYLLTIQRQAKDNDRLIFFFNGHGFTDQIGQDTAGYIVPYDGTGPSTMISMDDIRAQSDHLRRLRHQLFVLNSCFGGLLDSLRPAAVDPRHPNYLVEITRRYAREFLTAGGADQSVRDDGPGGLSFFAAYFLEATRDGLADRDGKGVITFADLASYLVPRAASANQTPAWGVLPGDNGGEYIFTTGKPVVSVQPIRTSEESHALTRAADLPKVVPSLEGMRQPIDNVYRAWQQLDLGLYSDQWAPDAHYDYVQRGKRLTRGHDEIIAKRKEDFGRLTKVEVPKYQIVYEGYKNGVGNFAAEYTMIYHYKDGHVKSEHERESYGVAQDPASGAWQIRENHDYLK